MSHKRYLVFALRILVSPNRMRTLASSEDSDKMLHNAAFYQGLHYLLNLKIQRHAFFI